MAALDGHDRGQYGRGFIPQSFRPLSPGVPFGPPPLNRAAVDAICNGTALPRLLGRFSPRHGRGGRPFGPPNNRARPCRMSKFGSAAHSAGLPYPLSRFPLSLRERGKAVGLRLPLRRGFLPGCLIIGRPVANAPTTRVGAASLAASVWMLSALQMLL